VTRYIVVGAGAIGGAIGAQLTLAGRDAVLVARGDHLAALRADGLRLRSPDDDRMVPVTAVGGLDDLALDSDDVLVLTVKTHQVFDLLPAWADAPVLSNGRLVGTVGDLLPVLVAMNGVTAERLALRYVSRVFGVCVWMPAVHLTPGEVIIRATPQPGMFHIGAVPAQPDGTAGGVDATRRSDDDLLRTIGTDWEAAGLAVRLVDDVMPWKYRKLLSNLGNAVQALVGRNRDSRPIADALEAEGRSVLEAVGVAYTGDDEEDAARAETSPVRPVPGAPADLGGSTWQSLTRGATRLESDYLNGEIVLLARQHGLDAPLNARVAGAARDAARRGARPGDISAAHLARILGLDS
jgi:2-dehydropantoate 2-reductase